MRVVERYGTGLRLWRGSGVWALFYPLRYLLSFIYRFWLFVSARRVPKRAGAARKRSSAPGGRPRVISIGNLEVGGGGKTPCAVRLAEAIFERGGTPVVLSRGYRGAARRHFPCVVASGRTVASAEGGGCTIAEELLSTGGGGRPGSARAAELLGDEITLYRARGIPVLIDADRGRAAGFATRLFSATHVLLDDAFQNHSIEKDLEILLLDAKRPVGDGRLIPLGSLREEPSAIRRADAIVFTRAESERVPPEVERFVEGKPLFFARHAPVDLVDPAGAAVPLTFLAARECVLFSGVARPASFEETIVALGARPRLAYRFDDHHRYRQRDIGRMMAEGGDGAPFITTEKDWAKVRDLFRADTVVLALRIEMQIPSLERLLELLG